MREQSTRTEGHMHARAHIFDAGANRFLNYVKPISGYNADKYINRPKL